MHFDLSRTYQIFYHQDHIGVCLASDKGPSIGVVFFVKSMEAQNLRSGSAIAGSRNVEK
jgi:hypothetical protein